MFYLCPPNLCPAHKPCGDAYLTTIYQPIEEMGKAAADMLLTRDAGARPWPVKMLDYRLIERNSVGPAPQ